MVGKLRRDVGKRRHLLSCHCDNAVANLKSGTFGTRARRKIFDDKWRTDRKQHIGVAGVEFLYEIVFQGYVDQHLSIDNIDGHIDRLASLLIAIGDVVENLDVAHHGDDFRIVEQQDMLGLYNVGHLFAINGIDDIAVLEPLVEEQLMVIVA